MSEKITTTIEAEEVVKKTVNSNGQIYLGRDLAGKSVKVGYEIIDEDE